MKRKTINELVMEYFESHVFEELDHGPVVDWVTNEYLKTNKTPPRDVWRAIRSLHEKGILIKIKNGIYKYDPNFIEIKELEDFTQKQREEIFRRDSYRCVICGRGGESGYEIHADHIKPRSLGGKAVISNGQTLCSIHNFRKKNYGQTETGKKMFIKIYELAKKAADKNTEGFCKKVLETYDQYHINDHIEWKK